MDGNQTIVLIPVTVVPSSQPTMPWSATWEVSQLSVFYEIRDITASTLAEVCNNVATEPPIDVYARARFLERVTGCILWCKGVLPERILQLFNRLRYCLQETWTSQEKGIWTTNQRSWMCRVNPSCTFYNWWHGKGSSNILKRLADMIVQRRQYSYPAMMGWLRCRLSFASLRASIKCIGGTRSSFHRPVYGSGITLAASDWRIPSN